MSKALQIFRPTVTQKITQGWGENRACIWPNKKVTGTSTFCPAGSQSFYRSVGMLGHNGIDISSFIGENVYHSATFDGWIKTEYDQGGGIGVDVISNEPIFFPGEVPKEIRATAVLVPGGFIHHVKMRYWHLKSPVGHDGKQVACGTVIGLSGNTGASSGPHLHFAPKWCLADGHSVGNDNGYYGAFDPTPFYKHEIAAVDHVKYLNIAPSPLTSQEIKDLMAQLNVAQKVLRTLQSLKNNL